jgi:hypothetical protein
MLRDLFEAAFKLSPEKRQRTVRIVAALAVLLLLVVFLAAGRTAIQDQPADHPIWEVAVLLRLALARAVLSLALIPYAAFVGVVLYQTLENTELGRRLVTWSDVDSEETKARKVGNGARLLAVCLGSSILGVLLGVLR